MCEVILVSEDNDFYHFEFRDNGTGVEEQHLSHLFDRFYRIDSDVLAKTAAPVSDCRLCRIRCSLTAAQSKYAMESWAVSLSASLCLSSKSKTICFAHILKM